jgi:hypothetical protein
MTQTATVPSGTRQGSSGSITAARAIQVSRCRWRGHHQVVIHRWGWTLVLNPGGTTTAWNPDRTKVLHSHGPPTHAG